MQDFNGELALIDPRKVVVDHSYQRPEKGALIAAISSDPKWELFGSLVVFQRSGAELYHCADGQQRLRGVMASEVPPTRVPAVVFEVPAVKDEAAIFEMEAWAWGEDWTDAPKCVSPVLVQFGQRLNDRFNEENRQLLKRFLGRLGGTAGDGQDVARRAIAARWVINTGLPDWLELAGLTARADELRKLEVTEWTQELSDLTFKVRSELWDLRPYATFRRKFREAFEAEFRKKLEEAGVKPAEAAVAAVAAGAAEALKEMGHLDYVTRQKIYRACRDAAREAVKEGKIGEAVREKVKPLADAHRDAALELFEQLIDPKAVTA